MLNSKITTHTKNNNCINDLRFKELLELEKEVDWDKLIEDIFPHYIRSKTNGVLLTVESMLRIYILRRHFEMSPSDAEEALFKIDVFRDFALIDLDRDVIPNASGIANFNTLFEEKSLAQKIEQAFNMQPIRIKPSVAF